MRRMFRTLSSAATATLLLLSSGAEAQSMKKTVEGVTNFTQVEATIACAGATKPSAIAALKTMGYKTVVNLRMASETQFLLPAQAVAARAAGLQYVHLPFNTPASAGEDVSGMVREFLKVTSDPANRPLFVHCAGAGRAAAMWMIKRIVVDGWDEERAWKEALMTYDEPTSPALVWARGYARTFKR